MTRRSAHSSSVGCDGASDLTADGARGDQAEHVVTCVMMLVGALVFGYIIGQASPPARPAAVALVKKAY